MLETLRHPFIGTPAQPSLSEYWAMGDPNQEKPPVLEERRDDLNPTWVLAKLLALDPKFAHITNVDSNRHYATVLILPKGIYAFDGVWRDPRFAALSNAYNGATKPNLEPCRLWSKYTKTMVEAWSSYNNRQYHARLLRPEENNKQPQPERFNGVILPTAHTIKELVSQVVKKSTS